MKKIQQNLQNWIINRTKKQRIIGASCIAMVVCLGIVGGIMARAGDDSITVKMVNTPFVEDDCLFEAGETTVSESGSEETSTTSYETNYWMTGYELEISVPDDYSYSYAFSASETADETADWTDVSESSNSVRVSNNSVNITQPTDEQVTTYYLHIKYSTNEISDDSTLDTITTYKIQEVDAPSWSIMRADGYTTIVSSEDEDSVTSITMYDGEALYIEAGRTELFETDETLYTVKYQVDNENSWIGLTSSLTNAIIKPTSGSDNLYLQLSIGESKTYQFAEGYSLDFIEDMSNLSLKHNDELVGGQSSTTTITNGDELTFSSDEEFMIAYVLGEGTITIGDAIIDEDIIGELNGVSADNSEGAATTSESPTVDIIQKGSDGSVYLKQNETWHKLTVNSEEITSNATIEILYSEGTTEDQVTTNTASFNMVNNNASNENQTISISAVAVGNNTTYVTGNYTVSVEAIDAPIVTLSEHDFVESGTSTSITSPELSTETTTETTTYYTSGDKITVTENNAYSYSYMYDTTSSTEQDLTVDSDGETITIPDGATTLSITVSQSGTDAKNTYTYGLMQLSEANISLAYCDGDKLETTESNSVYAEESLTFEGTEETNNLTGTMSFQYMWNTSTEWTSISDSGSISIDAIAGSSTILQIQPIITGIGSPTTSYYLTPESYEIKVMDVTVMPSLLDSSDNTVGTSVTNGDKIHFENVNNSNVYVAYSIDSAITVTEVNSEREDLYETLDALVTNGSPAIVNYPGSEGSTPTDAGTYLLKNHTWYKLTSDADIQIISSSSDTIAMKNNSSKTEKEITLHAVAISPNTSMTEKDYSLTITPFDAPAKLEVTSKIFATAKTDVDGNHLVSELVEGTPGTAIEFLIGDTVTITDGENDSSIYSYQYAITTKGATATSWSEVTPSEDVMTITLDADTLDDLATTKELTLHIRKGISSVDGNDTSELTYYTDFTYELTNLGNLEINVNGSICGALSAEVDILNYVEDTEEITFYITTSNDNYKFYEYRWSLKNGVWKTVGITDENQNASTAIDVSDLTDSVYTLTIQAVLDKRELDTLPEYGDSYYYGIETEFEFEIMEECDMPDLKNGETAIESSSDPKELLLNGTQLNFDLDLNLNEDDTNDGIYVAYVISETEVGAASSNLICDEIAVENSAVLESLNTTDGSPSIVKLTDGGTYLRQNKTWYELISTDGSEIKIITSSTANIPLVNNTRDDIIFYISAIAISNATTKVTAEYSVTVTPFDEPESVELDSIYTEASDVTLIEGSDVATAFILDDQIIVSESEDTDSYSYAYAFVGNTTEATSDVIGNADWKTLNMSNLEDGSVSSKTITLDASTLDSLSSTSSITLYIRKGIQQDDGDDTFLYYTDFSYELTNLGTINVATTGNKSGSLNVETDSNKDSNYVEYEEEITITIGSSNYVGGEYTYQYQLVSDTGEYATDEGEWLLSSTDGKVTLSTSDNDKTEDHKYALYIKPIINGDESTDENIQTYNLSMMQECDKLILKSDGTELTGGESTGSIEASVYNGSQLSFDTNEVYVAYVKSSDSLATITREEVDTINLPEGVVKESAYIVNSENSVYLRENQTWYKLTATLSDGNDATIEIFNSTSSDIALENNTSEDTVTYISAVEISKITTMTSQDYVITVKPFAEPDADLISENLSFGTVDMNTSDTYSFILNKDDSDKITIAAYNTDESYSLYYAFADGTDGSTTGSGEITSWISLLNDATNGSTITLNSSTLGDLDDAQSIQLHIKVSKTVDNTEYYNYYVYNLTNLGEIGISAEIDGITLQNNDSVLAVVGDNVRVAISDGNNTTYGYRYAITTREETPTSWNTVSKGTSEPAITIADLGVEVGDSIYLHIQPIIEESESESDTVYGNVVTYTLVVTETLPTPTLSSTIEADTTYTGTPVTDTTYTSDTTSTVAKGGDVITFLTEENAGNTVIYIEGNEEIQLQRGTTVIGNDIITAATAIVDGAVVQDSITNTYYIKNKNSWYELYAVDSNDEVTSFTLNVYNTTSTPIILTYENTDDNGAYYISAIAVDSGSIPSSVTNYTLTVEQYASVPKITTSNFTDGDGTDILLDIPSTSASGTQVFGGNKIEIQSDTDDFTGTENGDITLSYQYKWNSGSYLPYSDSEQITIPESEGSNTLTIKKIRTYTGGSTSTQIAELEQTYTMEVIEKPTITATYVSEGSSGTLSDGANDTNTVLDGEEIEITIGDSADALGTVTYRYLFSETVLSATQLEEFAEQSEVESDCRSGSTIEVPQGTVTSGYLYVQAVLEGSGDQYMEVDPVRYTLVFADQVSGVSLSKSTLTYYADETDNGRGVASVEYGETLTFNGVTESDIIVLYTQATTKAAATISETQITSTTLLATLNGTNTGNNIVLNSGTYYIKRGVKWYSLSAANGITAYTEGDLYLKNEGTTLQELYIGMIAGDDTDQPSSLVVYKLSNESRHQASAPIALKSELVGVSVLETLYFDADDNDIYYTVAYDGATPSAPSGSSDKYVETDGITTWTGVVGDALPTKITIKLIAIDPDGNELDSDTVSYTYNFSEFETVANPTSTPSTSIDAISTITPGQTILLSTATSEASIYYKTSEMSDYVLYESGVEVPLTDDGYFTVTAIAKKSGFNDSEAVEFVFAFPDAVSQPYVTPSAGSVPLNTEVSLGCVTEDAIIYYEIGYGETPSDPDISSPIYDGAQTFVITQNTTIKAMSMKSGMRSEVITFEFYPQDQLDTPTASISSGTTVASGTTVTFSASSDATIYYTVDGSDPTLIDNTMATTGTSYMINGAAGDLVIIKLCAKENQYSTSEVVTYTYLISEYAGGITSDVETGSTVSRNSSINLTTDLLNATIYYTLDGSEPTTSSSSGNTIDFSGTTASVVVVKAISVVSGGTTSTVATFVYNIKADTKAPTIIPAGGELIMATEVAITATEGSIYYTTDGETLPSMEEGTLYEGTITITTGTILKAVAVSEDGDYSEVVTAEYTVAPKAEAPTANETEGVVESGAEVTLSTATSGGIIYYTIDEAAPTRGTLSECLEFSQSIVIDRTMTIYAITYHEDMRISDVTQLDYVVETVDGLANKEAALALLEEEELQSSDVSKLESKYEADVDMDGTIYIEEGFCQTAVTTDAGVIPSNSTLVTKYQDISKLAVQNVQMLKGSEFTILESYLVTLYSGGSVVEPDGTIKVEFSIPEDYENASLTIATVDEDSNVKMLTTFRENDKICAYTDQTGTFGVVGIEQIEETVNQINIVYVVACLAGVALCMGLIVLIVAAVRTWRRERR